MKKVMPDRLIVTCNKCGQPSSSLDYPKDAIQVVEEDDEKALVSFRCVKCGEIAEYNVRKVTPVRMVK